MTEQASSISIRQITDERGRVIATVVDDLDGLRVTPNADALAIRPTPGPLIDAYLHRWGQVYDSVYVGGGMLGADEDFSGWRDSATGEMLPIDHMREWLDRTIELITGTDPRWIIEIGCGSGLIARRLRDRVDGYVGLDVAPSAVIALRRSVGGPTAYTEAAAHQLTGRRVRRALQVRGFPAAGPDCVVLNSVIQYFPNVDYLATVVAAAIGLLAPGGRLVIGDVRDARTLLDFATEIETARGGDRPIIERARARAESEPELLISPAALAALATACDRPTAVEIRPKRLSTQSELTRYRYDAIITVDPDAPEAAVDGAAVAHEPVREYLRTHLVEQLGRLGATARPRIDLPPSRFAAPQLSDTPEGDPR